MIDDLEVMMHRKPESRTLSLTRIYEEYIPAYSLANDGKYWQTLANVGIRKRGRLPA